MGVYELLFAHRDQRNDLILLVRSVKRVPLEGCWFLLQSDVVSMPCQLTIVLMFQIGKPATHVPERLNQIYIFQLLRHGEEPASVGRMQAGLHGVTDAFEDLIPNLVPQTCQPSRANLWDKVGFQATLPLGCPLLFGDVVVPLVH